MEQRIKLLVAVGAAVAANCQPCLENLRALALVGEVEEKEILEAIGVAKMVRKGVMAKTDELAASFFGGQKAPVEDTEKGCICDFG